MKFYNQIIKNVGLLCVIITLIYCLYRFEERIINTSLRQGLVTEVWQRRKHQN